MMLGGDCNPCCGGWYCCPEPSCGVIGTVASVTVTITPQSSQYVVKYRARQYCASVQYYQLTSAVPCNAVSGTHALAKTSATTWTKTLPLDSVGCHQPVVSLEFQYSFSFGTRWVLSVTNPSYAHQRWTATGTTPFKELSDMLCTNTGISSDANKCTMELEAYSYGFRVGIGRTQAYYCSPQTGPGGLSFVGTLNSIPPANSSDESGPPPDPNNVSSSTGSLECDVNVVIA
jgi:hypothetical protein